MGASAGGGSVSATASGTPPSFSLDSSATGAASAIVAATSSGTSGKGSIIVGSDSSAAPPVVAQPAETRVANTRRISAAERVAEVFMRLEKRQSREGLGHLHGAQRDGVRVLRIAVEDL